MPAHWAVRHQVGTFSVRFLPQTGAPGRSQEHGALDCREFVVELNNPQESVEKGMRPIRLIKPFVSI